MEEEKSLKEILELLLGKIGIIAIAAAVFGVASYFVSAFIIEPRYESTTTLYVANDSNKLMTDMNAITSARNLAKTYLTMLKGNTFTNVVEKGLEEKAARRANVEGGKSEVAVNLSESIEMAVLDQTEILEIKVKTRDARLSSEICEIIGEKAPEYLSHIVGQAGRVEVIDKPGEMGLQVWPKVWQISLIGVVAGAFLAIIIVLMRDSMDDSVKGSEGLRERVDKSIVVLGEVLEIESKKNEAREREGRRVLINERGIPFSVKESYKTIRSNVMFQMGLKEKKVIAISSANPGEGKSSAAANIAIAMANMEKTVLLIDGDMRKPVQHKNFRLTNKEGLSTLVLENSELGEAIKSSTIKDLDILTAGPIPPNPAEILASKRFKGIIEKLEEFYEYIIIDTPPINIVSDAMVLKGNISGILLVIRQGETSYEEVKDSMRQIELADIEKLGVVINGVKQGKMIGRKEYRDYKYEYKEKV